MTLPNNYEPSPEPLCWIQPMTEYTACDRKKGHLGRHSWEAAALERKLQSEVGFYRDLARRNMKRTIDALTETMDVEDPLVAALLNRAIAAEAEVEALNTELHYLHDNLKG
jgi:hypothetical protein